MDPLEQARLKPLMARSGGASDIAIGLIDGPVNFAHPGLRDAALVAVGGRQDAACAVCGALSCLHGSFVAGILAARRDSGAAGVCPECSLLVRPIFAESDPSKGKMPTSTGKDLAAAILEVIAAGARIINISAAFNHPSSRAEFALQGALDRAAVRGVLVVAAAGNQGAIGGGAITAHPWVIPVAACGRDGSLMELSNLSGSIGRRGLAAPGENITSLDGCGGLTTSGGTSAAAAFVTGALALLMSLNPAAPPHLVKLALTGAMANRRSLTPPPLDAWGAFETLSRLTRPSGRGRVGLGQNLSSSLNRPDSSVRVATPSLR